MITRFQSSWDTDEITEVSTKYSLDENATVEFLSLLKETSMNDGPHGILMTTPDSQRIAIRTLLLPDKVISEKLMPVNWISVAEVSENNENYNWNLHLCFSRMALIEFLSCLEKCKDGYLVVDNFSQYRLGLAGDVRCSLQFKIPDFASKQRNSTFEFPPSSRYFDIRNVVNQYE